MFDHTQITDHLEGNAKKDNFLASLSISISIFIYTTICKYKKKKNTILNALLD